MFLIKMVIGADCLVKTVGVKRRRRMLRWLNRIVNH
jgi:hypothetical protein